nr:MAG TPA: ribonucleoside-diphosphate reductase, adenosylcobalamin-dependent [Caudoviricetes sp.]
MEKFETIYKNEKEWLGEDNNLGIDIWKKKYADGRTYHEWMYDVTGGDMQLAKLIESKKFLFGGRILANRNNASVTSKKTYSNCYVIAPPEDNLESIFNTAKKLARTFSYGGGCGIDLSKLSFKGAAIHNAAKSSSGVVSFMELYDKTTEIIGQNGRRGALMMSLKSNHPDILEFINVKRELDKINNANLSVRVDDDFMIKARDTDEENYELIFNRSMYDSETKTEKDMSDTKINPNALLMKLSEYNWETGEPGILFWDNICRGGLLSNEPGFNYGGVNPCAEEPLPSGGSCLLGALNLSAFCKWDNDYNSYIFDFLDFIDAIDISVRALNKVLDEGVDLHPLREQTESVTRWRQIGLGVMGFADALIKLGMVYGSNESFIFIKDVGSLMAYYSLLTSNKIAIENPSKKVDLEYDALLNTRYMLNLYNTITEDNTVCKFFRSNNIQNYKYDKKTIDDFMNSIYKYGLANSQLLTVAPTGSISTMIDVSGGIEPLFATHYNRVTKSLNGEDTTYTVYPKVIKDVIASKYGKCVDVSDIDLSSEESIITAHNIPYYDRLKVQSVWQRFIDAAISSTVNLKEDVTPEDICELYITAWELGLKGVTVFRDNCYRSAILTTNDKEEKEEPVDVVEEQVDDTKTTLKRGEVIPISDKCYGLKKTLTTGCGTLHLESFYDLDTDELRECFLSKGSTGGCNSFMVAVSRLISLAARAGVPSYKIIDQLKSAGTCPSYAVRKATMNDVSIGSSCPCAVGYALEELEKLIPEDDSDEPVVDKIEISSLGSKIMKPIEKAEEKLRSKLDPTIFEECPKCGEHAVFRTNGCITCSSCGYTKCD